MRIVIAGAAESTDIGKVPHMSALQLQADAARNAIADCGVNPADIDGIATAGHPPIDVAHYLGLQPNYVDGTRVGGCSFIAHVRHAAAAIQAGHCQIVLVTHGRPVVNPGDKIGLAVDPAMVHVFDQKTGARIAA